MRSKPYDDGTRAAVMAALLAGQGVNAAAKQFKIPRPTVVRWQQQLSGDQKQQVHEAWTDRGRMASSSLDELISAYLRETLVTLSIQARYAGRQEFLDRISGQEFAVQHGVLSDKVFRICAAAELVTEREGESEADTG